jgi:kynurenine formamidase
MEKIIDLTHPISSGMPVYPGTEPPVLKTECTIEDIGFLEKKITLVSHTGTHMDAPAHLIKDAKTLDKFPIGQFYGRALLLNLTNIKVSTIELQKLEPHKDAIRNVDFLLLHTGWSKYWGSDKYFIDYPVLSMEAAEWLGKFRLKGIGLDTISADKVDTEKYLIHKVFLQNNTVIIENLTDLNLLPCNHFTFSCFPMSFKDADGSPVRAVGIVN